MKSELEQYLNTSSNQKGTEDRVLRLMDEILKNTSIVQLATQQGIAVFKRFVYGDLKHVAEAMLEGKDIYYYDKKLTSNYRAYFDGDAKNFTIREGTRTVFGVVVSTHNNNNKEFWRVHILDGSFVFKYVTVDTPTNLDFNTEEEARLVTNSLNEMSRGN